MDYEVNKTELDIKFLVKCQDNFQLTDIIFHLVYIVLYF